MEFSSATRKTPARQIVTYLVIQRHNEYATHV